MKDRVALVYSELVEAFKGGGVHGFNVAYLHYEYCLEPPAGASTDPISLLAWLRDPAVHAQIRWPQDHFKPSPDPLHDGGVEWIASENQFIWAACLGSGDDSIDPIVELWEPTPLGQEGETILGRMLLSELTARILFKQHSSTGRLEGSHLHRLPDVSVLEPISLDVNLGCNWQGIGLSEYWYGWFGHSRIFVYTNEPDRFAKQYGDDPRYTWTLTQRRPPMSESERQAYFGQLWSPPHVAKEDSFGSEEVKMRRAAAGNSNATEAQLDVALNDDNKWVRSTAAGNTNATEAQLDQALNDDNEGVRQSAAGNPSATEAQLDQALNDESYVVREQVAWNRSATEGNLNRALDDENGEVRRAAAENPNATEGNLSKALDNDHDDSEMRQAAAMNPNANEGHLDRALNDEHVDVRWGAARNSNATEAQLDKALGDDSEWVRGGSAGNPSATEGNLIKALGDDSEWVRKAAAANPNATEAQLDKALNDEDWEVRVAAAGNPSMTGSQLDKALNDEDADVRRAAAKNQDSDPV